MDPIQKNARNPKRGIRQCILTQSAAATPSRILPPHPEVWIHAAQPLGLSPKRQTTARPLMRAKLLLRSTACIIQTNVASAVPRSDMLRNLYRLLVRSSQSMLSIAIGRALASYITGTRAANVLPVSLSTTPSERTRKNGPEQPEEARWWFPLILQQKQTGLLRNATNGS